MPTPYTIKLKDTLSVIARDYGTNWKDLYNAPANAAFRAKRPNPNLIHPGDVIMVPGAGYYEVPHVTLIPQQLNMSCWYASAQMLIKWKTDTQRMSTGAIPPELDLESRSLRDGNTGILNPQILALANRIGLRAVPPMSPTPEAIESWLRQYGPLWVNGKTHIVVIAGIRGMNVKVYDPPPVNIGQIGWRSLADWYAGGKPAHAESSRDTDSAVTAVFLHYP